MLNDLKNEISELGAYDSEPKSTNEVLPMPDTVTKVNEEEFYKSLYHIDNAIKMIFDLISICNYRSVKELKALVKVKNPDVYQEIDAILDNFKKMNAIKVYDDEIVWHCKEKVADFVLPVETQKKFYPRYIKNLVTRTILDHANGNSLAQKQSLRLELMPADDKTASQVKAAIAEFRAKITDINRQATEEKRQSNNVLAVYYGQSIPSLEDL